MKVVLERGLDGLATVLAAQYRNEKDLILEFVDSLSGSSSIEDKWVLVVSSQFGCPVNCLMCDTSGYYKGNPTAEELYSQVDHMVRKRYPNGNVPSRKFKVQFARMGEPALNPAVIDAILMVNDRLEAPGFMPCISTTAPSGTDHFFDRLKDINHRIFRGNFQLQFSIHSTSEAQRNRIIPIDKWDLERISEFGEDFYVGGRKIALNFALSSDNEVDALLLSRTFSPETFMFKFTPVNPTSHALFHGLVREDLVEKEVPQIADLKRLGFDVIVSIGDQRENGIGSNCGQLAALWKDGPSGYIVEPI